MSQSRIVKIFTHQILLTLRLVSLLLLTSAPQLFLKARFLPFCIVHIMFHLEFQTQLLLSGQAFLCELLSVLALNHPVKIKSEKSWKEAEEFLLLFIAFTKSMMIEYPYLRPSSCYGIKRLSKFNFLFPSNFVKSLEIQIMIQWFNFTCF